MLKLLYLLEGVALNWVLTFFLGIFLGPIQGKSFNDALAAVVAQISVSAVGFAISASAAPSSRLPYLTAVVLACWVTNIYNVYAEHITLGWWVFSILPIAVAGFLGGALVQAVSRQK